jgi:hypothetical protein
MLPVVCCAYATGQASSTAIAAPSRYLLIHSSKENKANATRASGSIADDVPVRTMSGFGATDKLIVF